METNKIIPTINVFFMLFLAIVTFGIYMPVWFLRRREWLNQLSSPAKLGSGAAIFVLVIFCIAALLLLISSTDESMASGADAVDTLISMVGGITILILAFKVRRILNQHFNVKHKLAVGFSGVFTFLFAIFYLQYKMNRLAKTQDIADDVA